MASSKNARKITRPSFENAPSLVLATSLGTLLPRALRLLTRSYGLNTLDDGFSVSTSLDHLGNQIDPSRCALQFYTSVSAVI